MNRKCQSGVKLKQKQPQSLKAVFLSPSTQNETSYVRCLGVGWDLVCRELLGMSMVVLFCSTLVMPEWYNQTVGDLLKEIWHFKLLSTHYLCRGCEVCFYPLCVGSVLISWILPEQLTLVLSTVMSEDESYLACSLCLEA